LRQNLFSKAVAIGTALALAGCATTSTRLPAQSAPAVKACPQAKQMSPAETEAYLLFYAKLSHLLPFYGKPSFEGKLKSIVSEQWPRIRLGDVSYLFYERVQNLVDRARLQNLITQTIGTDAPEWKAFNWIVHDIYVHQETGHNLLHPLAPTTEKLLRALSNWKSRSKDEAISSLRAETILRVTDHYVQLTRWRALNGDIMDERAAASAHSAALLGIGLVGAGVIVGTTVLSGPMVAGAGVIGAGASGNPVVAALLAKLAESAAAAALGFAGAPAAVATQGAYLTYTEAAKRSANDNTSFSCELSRQVDDWKGRAGGELLSSALYGASIGMGGAVLTFNPIAAKAVLYSAGFGTAVGQAYAVGKMSQKTIESLAWYKAAQQAEAAGDQAEAKRLLRLARDAAQEAGDQGLQSILIATLSVQVGMSFKQALAQGETAIRQLWAASADTVPSAATSIQNLLSPPSKIVEP
jgi:hypothetical protein